ncbi:hypothetical protein CSOJ01_14700 [Colletotrichum sojae]|uniref:Uncharacterized protein n=1 Tax=Colletotrichum sojae TaxID=2175907 RepID=A0A8H6MJL8_9PEZI|nr:hypothetical protein CSOJ01_14700 [Colletotrichum sojae]
MGVGLPGGRERGGRSKGLGSFEGKSDRTWSLSQFESEDVWAASRPALLLLAGAFQKSPSPPHCLFFVSSFLPVHLRNLAHPSSNENGKQCPAGDDPAARLDGRLSCGIIRLDLQVVLEKRSDRKGLEGMCSSLLDCHLRTHHDPSPSISPTPAAWLHRPVLERHWACAVCSSPAGGWQGVLLKGVDDDDDDDDDDSSRLSVSLFAAWTVGTCNHPRSQSSDRQQSPMAL